MGTRRGWRIGGGLAAGIAGLVWVGAVGAQDGLRSPDDLWQWADESAAASESLEAVATETTGGARPLRYRPVMLNLEGLERLEALTFGELHPPRRQSVWLPAADGTYQEFEFEEVPILAPELAARHPEIHTFRGQGVTDPMATVRLGWTRRGFHAQVLSPRGTVWIDRLAGGQTYAAYSRAENAARLRSGGCTVAGDEGRPERLPAVAEAMVAPAPPSPGRHRTLRLAVAATGEYTRAVGGSAEDAFAAMVATINRVSGIYERELAVSFELVAGTDQLIFEDPDADPFDDGDLDAVLCQSQELFDQRLGPAAYDLGHTFASAGGGKAATGAVCVEGHMGRAASGTASPWGDAFDVDLVAHEIGHQLGATHTYNGRRGGCVSEHRLEDSAYEPGSGSTIMGYPSVCEDDDLQDFSDPYFHAASLAQMAVELEGRGEGCGQVADTGNRAPLVKVAPKLKVPARTPFELLGVGSDPDGDALSFAWEQWDLGPQAELDAPDDGRIPLFRSWPPVGEPRRILPRLAAHLDGGSPGERLPQVPRTLHFRLTARDNRARGATTASDTTEVEVAAGPAFAVQPIQGPVSGGLDLTWVTAGTESWPGAAEVDVLLSLDGGATFPHLLAGRTPSDGRQVVLLPAVASQRAVLQVRPTGASFFAVSKPFSVEPWDALVVLVRHAEDSGEVDGEILPAGRERADELARILAASRLTHVVSSRRLRTIQTAMPAARAAGIEKPQPVGDERSQAMDLGALVQELFTLPRGSAALVVHHSTTVPLLIEALCPGQVLTIEADDHGDLVVATRTNGSFSCAFLHYAP